MKYCPKCKTEKEPEEFHSCLHRTDNLSSWCRKCKNKKSKETYNKNKSKIISKRKEKYNKDREKGIKTGRSNTKNYRLIINELKEKCFLCEENDYKALDFHHVDKKTEEVAKLISSASLERILAEIEKCIVLCSNCHRKYHGKRFSFLHDRPPYLTQLKFRFMFH